MPGWLNIDSSHLFDYCGYTFYDNEGYLPWALDGADIWFDAVDENHFFILDLLDMYYITQVCGRSNGWYQVGYACDPTDIDIFISDDMNDWGSPVAYGISDFQDTSAWQIIATIPKAGRYVKVVIYDTEDFDRWLAWGRSQWDGSYFSIFDVYYDTPPAVPVYFSGTCVSEITAGCILQSRINLTGIATSATTMTGSLKGIAIPLTGTAESESGVYTLAPINAVGAISSIAKSESGVYSMQPVGVVLTISGTASITFPGPSGTLRDQYIALMTSAAEPLASQLIFFPTPLLDVAVLCEGSALGQGASSGELDLVPYTDLIAEQVMGGTDAYAALSDRSVRLTGIIQGVSTVTGNIQGGTISLTGGVTATSGMSGNVTGTAVFLEGSIDCQSSLGPSELSGMVEWLNGDITTQSYLMGTLIVTHAGVPVHWVLLAGSLSAVSSISGQIGRIREITGGITAQSHVAGTATVYRGLTGTVASSSACSGRLAIELAGTIAASSNVSGSVGLLWGLVGTIAPTSSCGGRLGIDLRGALVATSTVTGSLRRVRRLTTLVSPQSELVGSLKVTRELTVLVASQSVVNARLGRIRSLSGQIACTSTVAGAIIRTKPLTGTIAVQSELICSYQLKLARKVRTTVIALSNVSGSVGMGKSLVGIIAAESTLSANLSITIYITGTIGTTSGLTGTVRPMRALNTVVVVESGLSGSLTYVYKLTGLVASQSSFRSRHATLELDYPKFMLSDVFILTIFSCTLQVSASLTGKTQNQSILAHSVRASPLLTSEVNNQPYFVHETRVNERVTLTLST